MSPVLSSSVAVAVLLSPAASARDAGRALGEAIREEMAAQGPIVTREDRALIAAKCGYAPGEDDSPNLHMDDGALLCANGRRVADDDTRALSRRISARARTHADHAMHSARVAKAKAEVARAAAAQARERADAALARQGLR